MATEVDDGVLQKNGEGASSITDRYDIVDPKHKVFLSHSGAQKDFVEQLCVDLETFDRYPFFDKRRSSLPIGEKFPKLMFDAIRQCQVGVLVLSEEFFTKTKWPMIELVAMVKELEKPNSNIKIIPVFNHISQQEYRDEGNRKQWVSQWEEWANGDKRISVEEWKRALGVLKPINSLVMNGIGDVNAQKQIVSAVCELVLPETRWDDSHVEGRLRLGEILCKKINQDRDGVHVIGLYGMGGIGKTTICKAMCNELFEEFQGRVCHAELKSASGVELLRDVLKRFTNTQHELLDGLQIDQCHDQLRRNIVEEAVFLAIDNVADSLDSIRQAKTYLGARWAKGSVIIVTSRSLQNLLLLRPYIDEDNCIEMPELEKDEARSLFLQHVTCGRDDELQMDEELITGCVERCYFSKGVGKGHHYIPLALKVLGEQLGCHGSDAERWKAQVGKIDAFDVEFSGDEHPIFSILRTSFDSLSDKAQMVFMDVALFLPSLLFGASIELELLSVYNYIDWLSMVHGLHIDETKRLLEGLKRKSLIEKWGRGYVYMHDLWYEFCVAETKRGSFGERRWVFLEEASSELGEISPPGRCWEHLRRMCFLNEGWRGLHGVHPKDFLNVTVLKLEIGSFIPGTILLELDLRGLEHLKSLEVMAPQFETKCVGVGSSKNLVFLSWESYREASSSCIEEIGHMTRLQTLKWVCRGCDESPDISMMTSLRAASLWHRGKVVTGLSSKLRSLQYLSLEGCMKLQECPGLGELYALEELNLRGCLELQEVPCLRLLTKLRVLNISACDELRAVPGLSDLVALEHFFAYSCYELGSLPDMRKLTKLKEFRCGYLSKIEALNLGEFPQLRKAVILGCRAIKSVTCDKPLCELTELEFSLCSSLEDLPDLRNFPRLKWLDLRGCAALMSLTSSVPLHELEILDLQGCNSLSALPDHLSGSTGLRELWLQQSGIVLIGEHIRELEESCKSLKVFPSSAVSQYGNEYVYSTDVTSLDRSIAESEAMEINLRSGYQSRKLPETLPSSKVTRLIYSNAGDFILALTSDGVHKRWDWEIEASVSVAPQLWRPVEGGRMVNIITGKFNPEEVVPCMDLFSNDNSDFVTAVSASGGQASVYQMERTRLRRRSIQTPSAATSLAFHHRQVNAIVVGMEDSTIQIYEDGYDVGNFQAVRTLKGHQKRITGLAFSARFNLLVSLGADAHLCVWKVEEWSKRHSKSGPDRRTPCVGDIRIQFRIQFRNDQEDLLVVAESQLAVYDILNLERPVAQWVPQSPFAAAITDATYSCNGREVYASFVDGSIAVLSADYLQPMTRFAPPIHQPRGVSGSTASYPLAIAAHPKKRGQFALGMSDGSVIVVEPWRDPADKESGSGEATGSATAVEDGPRVDEREEERTIPDTDVVRCGCFEYCSCVFFTSAVSVCFGYSRDVTGADTGKEESDDIEINMQNRRQSRRLPDTLPQAEVTKLIYSNAGDSLVALASNGMHKRWDWENEVITTLEGDAKATVSYAPHLWSPDDGTLAVNDSNHTYPGEVVPCMALSRDNWHVISASGGEVSVFHMLGTRVLNSSIQIPSAATSLAFHPHEEHVIVIGKEDSTIQIYDNRLKEVCYPVEPSFSSPDGVHPGGPSDENHRLGILDIFECACFIRGRCSQEWSKRQSNSGPLQPDRRTSCVGDIRVQFRNDQRGLLVVSESQLTVYDVLNLDRPIAQGVLQRPSTAAITDATFSCDGEIVYAAVADGFVDVFSAYNLRLTGGIAPAIYTPQGGRG